jgi:uncharacterized membrane protein YgcG
MMTHGLIHTVDCPQPLIKIISDDIQQNKLDMTMAGVWADNYAILFDDEVPVGRYAIVYPFSEVTILRGNALPGDISENIHDVLSDRLKGHERSDGTLFYYTTVEDDEVYSCNTMPIISNRLIQYAVMLPTEPLKRVEGCSGGGSGGGSGSGGGGGSGGGSGSE